ncbi:hypothetical protein HY382_02190 [Candidatus Curtissbacteria bacterium]|nr:hypothetical protein [Candidatus Curtissbacteria bacterium]
MREREAQTINGNRIDEVILTRLAIQNLEEVWGVRVASDVKDEAIKKAIRLKSRAQEPSSQRKRRDMLAGKFFHNNPR